MGRDGQGGHPERDGYWAEKITINNFDAGQVPPPWRSPRPGAATASGPVPAPAPGRVFGGVPARNRGFIGRDELLARVRDALAGGGNAAAQALHGFGGVGKTQLATEYAHRFAAEYDVVWWVSAEQPGLIGEQFAALAAQLGCAAPGAPVDLMWRAVSAALRARGSWLLVFDNAERPGDIAGWLPDSGHVLITSRAAGWDELADAFPVNVFTRAESAALLLRRVPSLTGDEADQVAAALGDLPLAVAQAAGYMALTDIPAEEYIALLTTRPAEILGFGAPSSYPRSLAVATRLSFDRISAEDPAAADVAAICAFLAAEPVPTTWFPRAAQRLPQPLRDRAADPVAWRQVVAQLRGSALVRVDRDCFLMHRLTQSLLRAAADDRASAIRDNAARLVVACQPGDSALPASWPDWATLLPHLLALDPAEAGDVGVRGVALRAISYLERRGDARAARELAQPLHTRWRARLGPDDRDVLNAATALAFSLSRIGEHRVSRELGEDVLARSRRVLGEDHPDTLTSASNLAYTLHELGEYGAARDLVEDVLARERLVVGEDHPDTLGFASNLASTLRGLGEYGAARELEEDVLARQRRVVGEDHPDTLASAGNLASTLRGLGEYGAARDLAEDVLARQRRVLGDDHPNTRWTKSLLARILKALGEVR
jgi:hypothetical protein